MQQLARTALVVALPVVAVPAVTFAQELLVVDHTLDQIHLFSAVDGSTVQLGFVDLNASTGTPPGLPWEAIYVGAELWISDREADVIFRWSGDGSTYLGEVSVGLNDPRGLCYASNGHVYICNALSGPVGSGYTLVEVDAAANLIGSFPVNAPFDVYDDGGTLLVSNTDSAEVDRYDYFGNFLGRFTASTTMGWPEQITRALNGDYLVGGFFSTGIHVFDASGTELNYLNMAPLGGGPIRAGYRLTNGNYLFTGFDGVSVFNSSNGTLAAVLNGVSAAYITERGGPIGTPYCGPAVPNSSGMPGMLQAFGSAFVADNQVGLIASGLPPGRFGYFLNSQVQGFLANPLGSQGNLCLSGSIGRYNQAVFTANSTGVATLSLNLASTPTPVGPVAVAAGQTWNFQCWYRDLNPSPTSNFTDATSVGFQ